MERAAGSPARPFLKDVLPDEPGSRVLTQFLDIFVRPELERRHQEGLIQANYVVNFAQAVLYPDARQPVVRLNDEVIGQAIARLGPGSTGREYTAGAPIYVHELDAIERFELPDDEADFGHITMIGLSGKIALFFDARRNRGRAKTLVDRSKQFFRIAEFAFQEQMTTPFVDNLFSAAELAVKGALWTGPLGFDFAERMRHGEIGSAFGKYVKWGNAHPRLLKTFNEVANSRPNFRYKSETKALRQAVRRRWIEDVRAMIAIAEAAVVSVFEATDSNVSSGSSFTWRAGANPTSPSPAAIVDRAAKTEQ